MSERPSRGGGISLRVRAEAAAWLAAIRGSNRTSELESRFRRWLADSEANRDAWERLNDAWEIAEGLVSRFEESRADHARPSRRRGPPRMLFAVVAVLSAALVALFLAWFVSIESRTVNTVTGERRLAILPDGSRVTLNTDTRLVVEYDDRVRGVRLERGEALFDVRRIEGRPFVVRAGPREVRALGTAFEVRRDGQGEVSVTLIEGRISIAPTRSDVLPAVGLLRAAPGTTIVDSPGERVTFVPHAAPKIDRPPLQQVIAWQSGEVVFNNTPLSEAAREMNRYSERQIVVAGSDAASLRVGGLFQAGESVAFAHAVAETFGLEVREEGQKIVLSRSADAPSAHRE